LMSSGVMLTLLISISPLCQIKFRYNIILVYFKTVVNRESKMAVVGLANMQKKDC